MGPAALAQAPAPPPNIVVILSDDHGYADVSCYEHDTRQVRTPNIDRIARRGVRFTQGYASGYVCAPTRAGLLTGRYQQRFGMYTASDSRAGLPLGEITLADVLRQRGYATAALGKWHLGLDEAHHPLKRGFDEFYGFLGHGGHDYFDFRLTAQKYDSIWRNRNVIEDQGYLTDNLGREAVGFVQRNSKRPFFLYLAFNAVHAPLQAPEETIRKYSTGNRDRDTYLAMLEHEDSAVGRLLDELGKQKLDRNTLIFFLSDNGGARNTSASNGRLRDYKHTVYEGGIRVPFLVSWPSKLRPGVVSNEPVMSIDIMPTAVAAAGGAMPRDRVMDGRDLMPALTGKASGPVHESLYWDCDEGRRAIRQGRWKLVDNQGALELFDIEADLSEKRDVSAQHPDMVGRLKADFDAWRKPLPPRIWHGGDEEGAPKKKKKKKKA
jgi:arylsulfatase A-like enzyme